MRVLFANATSEFGGSEQVILSLAKRLPSYGVDVSVALLQPGPFEDILRQNGIEVLTFPERYRIREISSVLRCARWLTLQIKKSGAHLLHSNLTAHLIGSWAARRAGVPELWHLHDYPFHFDRLHALSRMFRADFCLFTTEFLRSGEPALARTPHTVIHPDCVDVASLQSAPEDPAVLDRLGLEPGTYFLTVTRLQQHKGHRFLIEAAAEVYRAHPDLKWVIAGAASGNEQKLYLAELEKQIDALGLKNQIILPGFVANSELPSLFRGAIALVHPAITEGYGLVLLEAMAYGTPVIAAAAAGPAEIVENERNGLLVPTECASTLSHAMERLITDPLLSKRLSAQASKDMEGRSLDVMVEKTIAVYRQMLGTAN